MAARIDNRQAQLLTRNGLDWTDKYPSVIAALANLNVKTAYLERRRHGQHLERGGVYSRRSE